MFFFQFYNVFFLSMRSIISKHALNFKINAYKQTFMVKLFCQVCGTNENDNCVSAFDLTFKSCGHLHNHVLHC